ncbi:MAG: TonB family protein [Candidatus Hydrogenedentota bacterium]|nr:MAG: TonB family protein [Candidatus Hydrogenedentota bacterium]
MRTRTLESDDRVFPGALFLSLILHSLLALLLPVWKHHPPRPLTEIVHSSTIAYQNFPQEQLFKKFSADKKIFSQAKKGLEEPTSGDVKVEPEKIEVTPEIPQPMQVVEEFPEPIPATKRRIHLAGDWDVAPEKIETRQPSRQLLAATHSTPPLPREPKGIVSRNDAAPAALQTPVPLPKDASPTEKPLRLPRTSAAAHPAMPAPPRPVPPRGMLRSTGPKAILPPTTPQPNQTEQHQPVTDVIPVGPNVTDILPEPPRPTGTLSLSSSTGIRSGSRRLIHQPLPEYPDWAERDNVQARVTFFVTVTPEGRVSRARLAVSSGFPDLDRLAEQSVKRWLYEPRPGQTEERQAVVEFVLKRHPSSG